MGTSQFGLDAATLGPTAPQVARVVAVHPVEVAIAAGGGDLVCGIEVSSQVLNRGLEVMDNTALTLCMDNRTPIVVFDLMAERSIERVILGEDIGTLVDDGGFTDGR